MKKQCKPDRYSRTGFETAILEVLQSLSKDGPACRCALEERMNLTNGAIAHALLDLHERGQVAIMRPGKSHPVWCVNELDGGLPNFTEYMYRKYVKG